MKYSNHLMNFVFAGGFNKWDVFGFSKKYTKFIAWVSATSVVSTSNASMVKNLKFPLNKLGRSNIGIHFSRALWRKWLRWPAHWEHTLQLRWKIGTDCGKAFARALNIHCRCQLIHEFYLYFKCSRLWRNRFFFYVGVSYLGQSHFHRLGPF